MCIFFSTKFNTSILTGSNGDDFYLVIVYAGAFLVGTESTEFGQMFRNSFRNTQVHTLTNSGLARSLSKGKSCSCG
jgi:hypothetical protein